MKAILTKGLYLLWGCLYCISVSAQNLPSTLHPEELANSQTETMHLELSLTPRQMQKIREINLKYAKEQLELEKSGKIGLSESMRSKFAEFKNVLTKKQYKKCEEKRDYWISLVQGSPSIPSLGEIIPPLE